MTWTLSRWLSRRCAAARTRRRARAGTFHQQFDWLEPRCVPAELTISNASILEGASGTTDAVFTVFLSQATAQTVTVDFFTSNGTASDSADYQAQTGTLTFQPGDTSKTITILVNGDTLDELDETFFVNLHNATGATISDNRGDGTIRDDDSGSTPSLSINNATVTEGASGTASAVFTVSISGASGQTVTVEFSTANGAAVAPSDYQAQSGTLTFAPGDTSETITILVNGDTIDELDETFLVNLASATNATIGDGQGVGTIRDDDPAPTPVISINNATVFEGTAGTVDAVFTVSLSQASDQTVTVQFSTADGSASAPSDYQSRSGTITFAAGDTSETVTVAVNGDTIDELDETFLVNLTSATNATIGDGQGVGTIRDDDPASSVTIAIGDTAVIEGDSGAIAAMFTVSLSTSSTNTVTVQFATADGTATAPSDYLSQSGTLTFAPGDTSKTVFVSVNGDTLSEADETFRVNLSNAVNATIADNQGTGTIRDDDPAAPPTISISDVTVTEGNNGTTSTAFVVSLSSASGQTVTVDFATADGSAVAPSDYLSRGGTLTFVPGDTSETIIVSVNGDTTDESTENFFVNLSNAANASINDGQAAGTITDDDPAGTPALSINDITAVEGNSGTTNMVFTVSLSAASGETVTVNFSTADGSAQAGSDYQARSGTLTFAVGDTSETISVPIVGDTADESNETFTINLSSASNATIADGQGVGTITDDDGQSASSISIGDVSVVEGDSGTANAIFTVTLSAASTQNVTVNFATADGSALAPSDYFSQSGTLMFAPGDTTETITIVVQGDTLDENNESFFVNLGGAVGAVIADGQGVGTIIDNDSPAGSGLAINDVSVIEGDSGTTTAVFTVTLSPASSQTVTVEFVTANGSALAPSDYAPRSGMLTFLPGETAKTIAISVNGDAADESDENFVVNLDDSIGASIADGQGIGTIIDDDSSALPRLTINNVTVTEGTGGTTTAVFTVSLSAATTDTVTVNFGTTDGSAAAPNDFLARNGTLTFAPGDTTETIVVDVISDSIDESNEQFFVRLTNAMNAVIGTSQGIGTITDDDVSPPPTPTRCTASVNSGLLAITGDNSANLIDLVDDGVGNITVMTDCGVSQTFSGVTRIQVRACGGNDDVRFRLAANLATTLGLDFDLGSGNDRAEIQASGFSMAQSFTARVRGSSGADNVTAAVDALLTNSDAFLSLIFDGGNGADAIDAAVRLQGTTRSAAAFVLGRGSNDSLRLSLDVAALNSESINSVLDGGGGADTCTAIGDVPTRKC
jgi:hypothetical protein